MQSLPQPRRSPAGLALRRRAGEVRRQESGLRRRHESDGSVRMRLRPAVVSPTALSALFYWLHDQTIERVLISFLDGEWSHELVRSREEAVRRCWRASSSTRPIAKATSCSSPAAADLPAPVRCAPCSTPGRIARAGSTRAVSPAAGRALNGRFVLVESAGQTPPTCPCQGRRQRASAARRISGCRAPRACASRTSPTMPTASGSPSSIGKRLTTGEPILEDVDAVITLAAAAAPKLPLPAPGGAVQASDNSTVLLGATLIDPRHKPARQTRLGTAQIGQ